MADSTPDRDLEVVARSPDEFASPARVAAATALRALGHVLVAREVDDRHLSAIAQWATHQVDTLRSGSVRIRPPIALTTSTFRVPADGGPMDHFADCVVSGQANPLGIGMNVSREGDRAVSRITLGAAFEGAPGRAHGGIVASILDDAMGFVLGLLATPAYTGRLEVKYRAPVPIGEELEVAASLRERRGRKLVIEGTVEHNGTVLAEAEGLFVTVDPQDFLHGVP